jgi:hypothetical protein
VPGPETDQLSQVAARHGCELVIGVIERAGSTLYCSAVFISGTGEVRGVHRKVQPTGSERLIWGQGDGSTLHVFDTPLGRIGAAICWENLMPALRLALYGQGIEFWCAPTADARDSHIATMRHIALEGRCVVLAANQFATRSAYPADYDSVLPADPGAVVCRGGSVIAGPLGDILAGPLYDQRGIRPPTSTPPTSSGPASTSLTPGLRTTRPLPAARRSRQRTASPIARPYRQQAKAAACPVTGPHRQRKMKRSRNDFRCRGRGIVGRPRPRADRHDRARTVAILLSFRLLTATLQQMIRLIGDIRDGRSRHRVPGHAGSA